MEDTRATEVLLNSPLVRVRCPACKAILERSALSPLPKGFECKRCGTGVILRGVGVEKNKLERCLVCRYDSFYGEKAFPKFWRFLFLGLAIVLSFFTYGISLFIFAILDWGLYQVLPTAKVCYFCKAEYLGFSEEKDDPQLKAYDPHKGIAYDARALPPVS